MITMADQVRMPAAEAVVIQATLLLSGLRKWRTTAQVKLDKYPGVNVGLTLSPAREALPFLTEGAIERVRAAAGARGPALPAPSQRWTACPRATETCAAVCVGKGGQGRLTSSQIARVGRTLAWFADPDRAEDMIADEVARKGRREPVWFRANVATDNPDRAARLAHLIQGKGGIVRAYDYTAVPEAARRWDGVTRALSYKGGARSERECRAHLANGGRVAVVFDIGPDDAKPATWHGYTVRDGDQHDVWPLFTAPGEVVGLYLKGTSEEKARARATGFAVKVGGA